LEPTAVRKIDPEHGKFFGSADAKTTESKLKLETRRKE
jgi:hypothetical protein